MDFHQFDHITTEDVKTSLIQDEAKLKNFGVKYHQFWVNEASGTVFCLIEGPDKATCEMSCPFPHNQLTFFIKEVETGFFKNMLGIQPFLVDDPKAEKKAAPDLGDRFILALNLWPSSIQNLTRAGDPPMIPSWASNTIREIIEHQESKALNNFRAEDIIAQFGEANQAFYCALKLQKQLTKANQHSLQPVSFKIGLCAGKAENTDYLKYTVQYAQCLSRIAYNQQIIVSSSVSKHLTSMNQFDSLATKIISPLEESFIVKVCSTSDQNLSDQSFTIAKLCKHIGISRPQLYRKITSITGRPPIIFLRDLRLEKARKLLLQKTENIAQVALEVGYSSPSYFTKCFIEKFGYKPSYILAH
ncbi:DUF4242 domain-containing protein [Echinicola marina]|uniref:nickel-binding protein n=1 Tax=Echinicola marina TaxID=2859768 RepID=UPI0021D4359D|nr:nickel-binding protein [Echinicola marina]UCS94680.1 DUF4242 domain-containing protein [Echinicola marina]